MSGDEVNASLFKEMIEKGLKNEKMEVPIHQLRKQQNESGLTKKQRIISMNLRNNIIKKKVVLPSSMSTLPFGYNKAMKQVLE